MAINRLPATARKRPDIMAAWREPMLYFGPLPRAFCAHIGAALHQETQRAGSLAVVRAYWEDDGDQGRVCIQFSEGIHPTAEITKQAGERILAAYTLWLIRQR